MVQHTPTINYREVLVDKTNWRNPYWNPWGNVTYQGGTTLLATVPAGGNGLTISNGTTNQVLSITGNGNSSVTNVQNSNITLTNSTTSTVNTTSNKITLNLNNVI